MGGAKRDNSGDDTGASGVDGEPEQGAGRDRAITLVTEFDPDTEEAHNEALQASLTVLAGPGTGCSFVLSKAEHVLGRDPAVDIVINDPGMSRRHATLSCQGAVVRIVDQGSTNGTFVNGMRLHSSQKLRHGDRLHVGQHTVLGFALQDPLELEASQRLYERSVRDGLTRLYNRGHLNERLTAEFAYARRHGAPLCVLLLDLDHFKSINDSCGHAAGDHVLVATADALLQVVRAEDLVARYGGEEFVVLARGIDATGAVAFAERIRRHIAGLRIQISARSEPLRVTTSVGVAHLASIDCESQEQLLAAADAALYEAKAAGRDRVVLADRRISNRPRVPRRRRASRVLTSPLDHAPGLMDLDGD